MKISVNDVIFTLFSPFLAYLIVFCLKCYKVSTDFCIYFFGPMAFIYLVVWFRSNVLDSFLLPSFQMPALNKVCTWKAASLANEQARLIDVKADSRFNATFFCCYLLFVHQTEFKIYTILFVNIRRQSPIFSLVTRNTF